MSHNPLLAQIKEHCKSTAQPHQIHQMQFCYIKSISLSNKEEIQGNSIIFNRIKQQSIRSEVDGIVHHGVELLQTGLFREDHGALAK